jgi:hypothetical protein
MFSYFKALRTTKSHLRYFDFCGNVLDAWGKTGGQQGDPLEMISFCLSINHQTSPMGTHPRQALPRCLRSSLC